jgi:hypothetical protein
MSCNRGFLQRFGRPPPRRLRLRLAERRAAQQGGNLDASRHPLQHVLSPALRVLDRGPRNGVGGQQRRVRRAALDGAENRTRSLDLLAVDDERRHGRPAETQPPVQPVRPGGELDLAVWERLDPQRRFDRLA